MRSAGLRDLAYLAESRSYDVCVPIKLTSKRTFNLSLMCLSETSCRVPGNGLQGRKCIAVAADSAVKIKNTKPGPLAITATMTSTMPYPPDAASMARATPTMRNNAARIV